MLSCLPNVGHIDQLNSSVEVSNNPFTQATHPHQHIQNNRVLSNRGIRHKEEPGSNHPHILSQQGAGHVCTNPGLETTAQLIIQVRQWGPGRNSYARGKQVQPFITDPLSGGWPSPKQHTVHHHQTPAQTNNKCWPSRQIMHTPLHSRSTGRCSRPHQHTSGWHVASAGHSTQQHRSRLSSNQGASSALPAALCGESQGAAAVRRAVAFLVHHCQVLSFFFWWHPHGDHRYPGHPDGHKHARQFRQRGCLSRGYVLLTLEL